MLLAAMVSALAPGLALAQTSAAQTNVAVVDVARVFEEYEMTRDLEALFDQARRSAAEEADKRRRELDERQRALAAFDPASEDFVRREAELSRKEIEFQVWTAETERRLKINHKRWLLKIYQNTKDTVAAIAKERNIDLVLTYDRLTEDAPDSVTLRQQILLQKVIYNSERIDLTSEVLTRLNKAYKDAGGIQSIDTTSLRGAPGTTTPPTMAPAP
jgi:Skp family chaperone for outer membrane proteins